MASFKDAYKIVKQNEGGYANNPNDAGGETYKGIARKRHPNWKGWAMVDAQKKNPAGFKFGLETDGKLQQAVLDFYKTEFWDALNLDHIQSQSIATELFDTGVNMGTGIAAMFLQQALNATNRNGVNYPDIKEDHQLGPTTIKVLNAHKRPGDVLKLINCLQGARYVDICRANPTNEEFMPGWLTRVAI